MFINSTQEGKRLVVKLVGELDHHSAEKVRTEIDEILEREQITEFILEMSGVTFMDSTGIGVVLGRYKKINERGGVMKISNAHGHIESILRMSGVFSIMENTNIA